MAVDIVGCGPIGNHGIGEGVEARYVESADKEAMVVVGEWEELVEIAMDDQGVERNDVGQGDECPPAFVALYFEYFKQLFHTRKFSELWFFG